MRGQRVLVQQPAEHLRYQPGRSPRLPGVPQHRRRVRLIQDQEGK
jgi:hypothetical protein